MKNRRREKRFAQPRDEYWDGRRYRALKRSLVPWLVVAGIVVAILLLAL